MSEARPTCTRTFTIPGPVIGTAPIEIRLLEPTLTNDNLGHKTWIASYLLARRLPSLRERLPPLQNIPVRLIRRARVLELGSGTGLLGIAAAAIYPEATYHLTDLPEIVPNLEFNISANAALFQDSTRPEGQYPITAAVLNWEDARPQPTYKRYDVILASDLLYSQQAPVKVGTFDFLFSPSAFD